MSSRPIWPSHAVAKKEGWFSRRHETSAEMLAHREHYRAHRGADARRRRAEERRVVAARNPELVKRGVRPRRRRPR